MTRYRWLQAEWPVSLRSLSKRMQHYEFAEGQASGFILDRARDDALNARFVERYEYTESIFDPYGKELSFDRLEFRQSYFRATLGWPGLELIDAPRSSQSLVTRLVEACNFELAVSPLSVDVIAWADAFQAALGAEAFIDSLQIGALLVDDGVKARILLKGDKDVRGASRELIQGRKHVLEKVQLRVMLAGNRCTIVLANAAAAKVDGSDVPDDVIDALRQSLPKHP